MNSDVVDGLWILGIAGAVLLPFLLAFRWYDAGRRDERREWEAKAVAYGFALWKLEDPETGRTEFAWKFPRDIAADVAKHAPVGWRPESEWRKKEA